ncbi:MAG: c-type cytochrome [Planctomycetes bacterium]|nr:c-type cytochrome [Planctomycetota bacterium]
MIAKHVFGSSLAFAFTLVVAGCEPEINEPLKLAGGKEVPAQVLNNGREGYMHYCYACHGEKGDGHGPSAPGLRPPPRNFTTGVFKWATTVTEDGIGLPRDEDLKRVVKNGLHGTAMLAWDVPDPILDSIVQYIKTFSEKWKEEEPGQAAIDDKHRNPWVGKESEATTRGNKVYHVKAQCISCHAAYEPKETITAFAKEIRPDKPAPEFRNEPFLPELKESEYRLGAGGPPLQTDRKVKILPPDFLVNPARSIASDAKGKASVDDVYRVIATGVGGTAMPTWKDNSSVSDEDLWAMSYYVKSLIDMKDTKEAAALRAKLK